MRSDPCLAVLGGLVLAGLLLPLNAVSENGCSTEIQVRRNTKYEVFSGQEVRIQCPVVFCNLTPPTVMWKKIEEPQITISSSSRRGIKIVWEQKDKFNGTSILVFKEIHRNDSGLYQCSIIRTVGHSINVLVHGRNETIKTKTTNPPSTEKPENGPDSWMYVYFVPGISLFVIMVIIISIVSMRGCRAKPKETETENQYVAIPMMEQPGPHGRLQPSPGASPIVPPSRRSTKAKGHQTDSTTPGDAEQRHPSTSQDRKQQRAVAPADHSSSLLYVTLNLQQRPAARTVRTEETEPPSEYAAIRVK